MVIVVVVGLCVEGFVGILVVGFIGVDIFFIYCLEFLELIRGEICSGNMLLVGDLFVMFYVGKCI